MNADIKMTLNLEKALQEKLSKNVRKLLSRNIAYVLKNEIAKKYLQILMAEFERFASYFNEEDPASPINWKDEFHAKMQQESEEIEIQGNNISVSFGDKAYLGYDIGYDPKSKEPLTWFVFYLEGLAGEYGFIDEQTYHERHPRGNLGKYGRFGRGFLIPREDYFSEGWDSIKPWEEASFPFVNTEPEDFFLSAVHKLQIKAEDFAEAIKASLEGRMLG